MHDGTREPMGPMLGDGTSGGLLQRLVGEEPSVGVGDLGLRLAPQQRGLDQDGCTVAESLARGGNVGDPAGVGERVAGEFVECQPPVVAGEIGDVVDGER